MAYIGVSPSNGVRRVHTYTATASQTTFSGAGAEGTTLSYKDSNFVDVYQNGIKLGDADYTSTSGTSIVLAQGASVDDLVVVVVFDVFSVADTVSKADGGTFDGNVTMGGTLAVSGETTLATHLNLGDNDKIKLGASGDLEIFHDGSKSVISDEGTGVLWIAGDSEVSIGNPAVTEYYIRAFKDGAVQLMHDNSTKLATASTGITVTGRQTINHNEAGTYALYVYHDGDSTNRYGIYLQVGDDDGTGTSYLMGFNDGDGNGVGSITFSGSNASFNTSSDYRLKNNIADVTDATAKLKELKPKKFSWKKDTNNTLIHGFLAHEVSSVVPEAVVGEKDAVDDDGKPIYQGIDHSKLVPLLVKTVQELEARITALESK